MTDNSPAFGKSKLECPHCNVVSQQSWFNEGVSSTVINKIITHSYLDYRSGIPDYKQDAISAFINSNKASIASGIKHYMPPELSISTCTTCNETAIWIGEEIVYPLKSAIDPPNEDLDDDIKSLYNEAASIYALSPKGSSALLRLALQKMMKQIGKNGDNINNDIKELVASGLSVKIQQALDIVRVVGNNAVHPGQIDFDDGNDVANRLFHLINFIANELITKPKELDDLYTEIVPEETRGHISQRDSSDGQ